MNVAIRISTGALLAVLVGHPAVAQSTKAARKQVLLNTTTAWTGQPYAHYPSGRPQFTILRLTIPPNTALPWHTHSIPEVGYVLRGSITLEDGPSGRRHTFVAGQAFGETLRTVHRGISGSTQTVLLVTYVGTPGVPTSIPARGAGKEY